MACSIFKPMAYDFHNELFWYTGELMSKSEQQMGKAKHQLSAIEQEKTELKDFIGQNLDAIVEYQTRSEQNLDQHQRIIEAITKNVGRPRFLYGTLLVVVLWVVVHEVLALFGITFFDPPPFSWLQGLITLSALSVSIMVLITQNREAKQTEHRRHLDLQVTLLVEQKVTKVIALLEELRRDLPSVQNRVDPHAEAMQETVDPQAVLNALKVMLQDEPGTNENANDVQ
jgi:uncharacterized membrane protein